MFSSLEGADVAGYLIIFLVHISREKGSKSKKECEGTLYDAYLGCISLSPMILGIPSSNL